MSISNALTEREYNKFKESASVSGVVGVVVLGPNGESVGGPSSSSPAYVQEVKAAEAEDNTNGIIAQALKPLATSTYSWSRFVDFGSNVTANVKASAGNVKSLYCHNSSGSNAYIQLHNTATTPSSSAVPAFVFLVPAGGAVFVDGAFFGENGYNFATGIAFAFSTTEGTYTAATAGDQATIIMYK